MLRINSSEISVTLSTTRVGFNSLSFPSFGGTHFLIPLMLLVPGSPEIRS
jgi:hypothetical protein